MISGEPHHDLEKGSQESAAHFTGEETKVQGRLCLPSSSHDVFLGFESGFQVCHTNRSLLHYGMDQDSAL